MPMNILERFHLALSYLEKSKRELAKWERVRESRMVDLTQFDLVRDRYVRHVKQAQELVDIIRNSQRESLPVLVEEIRGLRKAQAKLFEAISVGTVKPKQANKQNRSIADDIERLEQSRDWAELIAQAENTKVFAGPIDIPFNEYTKLLDLNEPEELPEAEKAPREVNPRNVLLLVVAGLLVWLAWSYYETLGHVKVRFSTEENKQIVRAVCENSGRQSVRVVVPWQDGIPRDDSPDKLQNRTFGVLVYVREKNKDDFQLLQETPGMWRIDGGDLTGGTTMTLVPQDRMHITLNTLELRKSGLIVDEVRVEITRYGGRVVKRFTTTLP